ncbi:MAG TPA: hypothetical protein VK530_15200, partial [Candidatus Acidoferrum sp.]|nr:hypothetical protein [Candidatus Acidoferrum sp.]
NGITISGDGHLWVAETDKTPKRVSVWKTNGDFVRAFYGPSQYGGGGFLDPEDTTRFFYADEGGTELKLDWNSGTSEPVAVYYRPELDPLRLHNHYNEGKPPSHPIHFDDRLYLSDAHNSTPTHGPECAAIWLLEKGIARPVAALGRVEAWRVFTTGDSNRFLAKLPGDKQIKRDRHSFLWFDASGDGAPQPDELTIIQGSVRSVNVMDDLSFVTGSGMHFKPQRFTARGVPTFDVADAKKLVAETQSSVSSGGGQALVARDGWTIFTTAPKPFSPYGIGGVHNGEPMWTYPSMWPGLHASHHAALPEFPGELIGTTRLIGNTIKPRGEAGELWAINGNKGTIYAFTTDGLFVATLFNDSREASWDYPNAISGMLVNGASLHEESFWPTITQTKSGDVYLQAMWNCLVKVEGLDKIRRLPDQKIKVTPAQLAAAREWFVQAETARQQTNTTKMTVGLVKQAPVIDGKADEWPTNAFVAIDTLRIQVGDWGSRRVKTQAALAVAGEKLFVCLKTGEPRLLENAGDSFPLHFKTGGGIDLMLGTDAEANPTRVRAGRGDVRLLVTQVKGKTTALLYRPVAPDRQGEPFPFSSPLRTIKFDSIEDVSANVTLASSVVRNEKERSETAVYEFSIPLMKLGLKPQRGETILGDIGVLRGNGSQTMQRSYWRNKATGITADVPSEAELIPKLWGTMRFEER